MPHDKSGGRWSALPDKKDIMKIFLTPERTKVKTLYIQTSLTQLRKEKKILEESQDKSLE